MNNSRAHITVRSATDILAIVPTLLAFIPTESVVAIYLQVSGGRSQLAMTARADLPLNHTESQATLRMLEGHAARYDAMILVAYSLDTAAADNALLYYLANGESNKVQAAISATPEGWAEVESGKPILRHAYPDASSKVTAEIVTAGLAKPLGGREDLRDSIAAPEKAEACRFAALVAVSEPMTGEHLAAWLQQWPSADGSIPTVSRDEAAVLVASVQNIQTRDTAWAAVSCTDAERHVHLWRQVARLVDGRPALPVLGLLGMASWIAGQGALANLVLDRAEQTEGYAGYSLFKLLEEVLRLGVDPRTWDRLRQAIVAQSGSDRC